MSDSHRTDAERTMQPKFSFGAAAGALLLIAATLFAHLWFLTFPNRRELGWREARIAFHPINLEARGFGPFRLAGAWRLTSDDPRFGGISSLAIDHGRMLALTDSGVLIRFSASDHPSAPAAIGELPDGPGSGAFKRNRDSEALLRDPAGRGWWVAFENRDELWLYDRDIGLALERIRLGKRVWGSNRGVEGMASDGRGLLLLPEQGDRALRVTGRRARTLPIADARGRISDVVAVGPGRYLAIERRLTPLGFRNALVALVETRSGYRFGSRSALPLGPLDNVEALAIERLPNGRRRLWLMTDDNVQPPMRTLLIALILPD